MFQRLRPSSTLWDQRLYSKARTRASKLEIQELLDWSDIAGTGMAQALRVFRKERQTDILDEVRIALITLAAAVDDIQSRYPA